MASLLAAAADTVPAAVAETVALVGIVAADTVVVDIGVAAAIVVAVAAAIAAAVDIAAAETVWATRATGGAAGSHKSDCAGQRQHSGQSVLADW
jgi:hypothetical protein